MARKPANDPSSPTSGPTPTDPGPPPDGPPADVLPPADVPVTAVVLFSSGVGYFEHAGRVTGDGRTELRFKAAQINDVLKSLVLQDVGGRVGNVVYPSQDPVEKTLKSFQVDITDNPSLADLLNQLRGAPVTVHLATDRVSGTVLGVEQRRRPLGKDQFIDVWLLNLVTAAGIRSVALDDVQRLELEEPALQEELNRALAALAGARDQDKKPVTIHFQGEGEREVRLGYVVEAPVWKTSYRLILPGSGDGEDKVKADRSPRIQGWAIVENQTDNDWADVELTLVSGRPISFVQELYEPLYVPRPKVEPELYASLRPQRYEGGMEMEEAMPAAPPRASVDFSMNAGVRRMSLAQPAAAAAGGGGGRGGFAKSVDDDRSVASVATAQQVGELFQYAVPGVSLPRRQSAMIPIIVDDVEATRLSIFNERALARHPLVGLRLKNTTGKHLLQGPVTVLDGGTYAGDAQIDNLPPGQSRLLSYGVDLQVLVNATAEKVEATVQGATIVKGVLNVREKNVWSQTYKIENKGPRDKTVLIEHLVLAGAKLVDTPEPVETTEAIYRFETPAPRGKRTDFRVRQEAVRRQEVALLTAQPSAAMSVYAKNAELPKDVTAALVEVIRRKHALSEVERQIAQRQEQVKAIGQEQGRLRDNLKTAPDKSQYQARLLNKLNEQETKIEALQAEIESLRNTEQEQRHAMEEYLAGLEVG